MWSDSEQVDWNFDFSFVYDLFFDIVVLRLKRALENIDENHQYGSNIVYYTDIYGC